MRFWGNGFPQSRQRFTVVVDRDFEDMAHASNGEPAEAGGIYSVLLDELLENDEDDLRLAFVYDSESIDVVYVRDDLLEQDLLPRIDEMRARALDDWVGPSEKTRPQYGDLEMTISVRESVVVLHFLRAESSGFVAIADRTGNVLERLLRL